MENKNKHKRYLIKPRFYCIVFFLLILGGMSYHFVTARQGNQLPNFYGWLTEEVMQFEEEHDHISIIYELDYSVTVRPTRVISQSLQPGTQLGTEPVVLTVKVSKGLPVTN